MTHYIKTRSTSLLGGGWTVMRTGKNACLVGLKMFEQEADELIVILESGEAIDEPLLGSLADEKDREILQIMKDRKARQPG